MITYQVERWETYCPSAKEIWPQHYEELSQHKAIAMDPDFERYELMDANDCLLIVTARDGIKLVGYYLFFLFGHLHYKSAGRMAFVDMYYTLPEYRNGTGMKLLKFAEKVMRERKIPKVYMSCKLHQDHDLLFKALGYTPSDRLYTKLLG